MEIADSDLAPILPLQPKTSRDWFGYLFTTIVGILATIVVAWYQLYASQKEVAAAELERARAVKQSAVAIIEEHALNGKKLEMDRLTRLIDQRRRDESITIPITVSEVVEQAEFNIESSHHLSIDRKEEIKPVFDVFYSDLKSRSFQPFANGKPSADVLNEIAKKIQEGKSSEALVALKRLDEAHSKELSESVTNARLGILEGLRGILSSPWKTSALVMGLVIYLLMSFRVLKLVRRRQFERQLERGEFRYRPF